MHNEIVFWLTLLFQINYVMVQTFLSNTTLTNNMFYAVFMLRQGFAMFVSV
jgi:hypothetical protein